MSEEVDKAKNSPLRFLTIPIRPAAKWLESVGFRANGMTLTGLGMTVSGGALAMARNLHPEWGLGHGVAESLTVLGGIADGADGLMAGLENRTEEEKLNGKLLDVTSDRLGALMLAMMRAETARQRGDWIGKYAALANAIVKLTELG